MAIGTSKSSTTPVAKQSRTHAHLSQSHDRDKGRQLHVTAAVKAGDVLMVDPPYAVIPVVDDPASSDDVLCSNSDCRRKVPRDTTRGVRRIGCPNRCVGEVVWCSTICRDGDFFRHVLECGWLRTYARMLREDEGEYYFGVLWLIVRVLAMRYIEQRESASVDTGGKEEFFSSGWTAMMELCDNRQLWPKEDRRHWRSLVKEYICADALLGDILLKPDDVLTLICQQESNSFGLYPRATGLASSTDRGEQYGAAIYPRSSIANHSCHPNVSAVNLCTPNIQGLDGNIGAGRAPTRRARTYGVYCIAGYPRQ